MLAVTKPVETALEKRCDAWHLRLDKMSFERHGGPETKTQALQAVCETYAHQCGALQSTADTRLQWLQRLRQQHGDRFGELTLALESRLLLHLGRANVLENVGLYCDHTTGLPLIPGTAVKGVLSTWACWADHFNSADGCFRQFNSESTQRRNFTAEEARAAQRILGDNSASGSESAGEVVFLGGFPLSPPELGLDIVNPHHRSDGSVETRLTPNTFLCIKPGTIWRFAFSVRPGAANPTDLLRQTCTWLEEALTQLGIGAKTAAGYGRFRKPTAEDLKTHERKLAEAKAAQRETARQAQADAEKAAQKAAAEAALKSDYPNDASFKNRVLNKLNPGQLEQMRPEIELLKKPENEARREELKELLTSKAYKDIRKRLRSKDWFPTDWLPSQ